MSKQYKLKHFLHHVEENLLLEHLKGMAINTVGLPKPGDKLDRVEGGFRGINDMAFESGILWLNAMVQNANVELPKEIENLPNPINQALYAYIKYSAIFDKAATQYYMVDIKEGEKGARRFAGQERCRGRRKQRRFG